MIFAFVTENSKVRCFSLWFARRRPKRLFKHTPNHQNLNKTKYILYIMKNLFKSGFDIIIEDISTLGASPFYIFLVVLFLILGFTKLFFWMAIGFVVAHVIVIIIRWLFPKTRPKKVRYQNFVEKIDASSFPSHHSLRMAMMVIFLALFFKNIYLTVFMISTALVVLFSRYYLKRHYIFDILGGAGIGVLLSLLIVWLY